MQDPLWFESEYVSLQESTESLGTWEALRVFSTIEEANAFGLDECKNATNILVEVIDPVWKL